MNLPLFIARRYLFAKKSHNVINIISIISAAGIAVGCAALIIIMSVFNGFNALIEQMHSEYDPDYRIEAVHGKTIDRRDFAIIDSCCGSHFSVMPVIEEDIFIRYDGKQSFATAKGVPEDYGEIAGYGKFIVDGRFSVRDGSIEEAVIGQGIAYSLGIRPHFVSPLELYFPDKDTEISLVNPAGSLRKENVFPSGITAIDYQTDRRFIFVSSEKAAELLSYAKGDCSYAELYLKDGTPENAGRAAVSALEKSSDGKFRILDRYRQNESIYKVAKSEKLAVYMILFFIILIISCNIFGSLSMLIIEKRDDMETLEFLGAKPGMARKIFMLEGWLVSLTGVISGTAIGCVLTLIQQHYGIIKMPGSFLADSYPVSLEIPDILITVASCALIGFLIANMPLRFTVKKAAS